VKVDESYLHLLLTNDLASLFLPVAGTTREDLRSDVQQLQSTDWAFAAVLSDGHLE